MSQTWRTSIIRTLILIFFTATVAGSQQADEIKHDKQGTHLLAYHQAFQKQPGHSFSFYYFKDSGVTARGSWKSITEHEGDQLSLVENTYIICTKSEMTCTEASARAKGAYPRADLTFYQITRWSDGSLEAQDDSPVCVRNILTIEFNTARVIATNVLKQDSAETLKTCANFGIHGTTTYQLW
jgi:hypothetical protein